MGVTGVEHSGKASVLHLVDVAPFGQPDRPRTLTVPHYPHYLKTVPLFPEAGLTRSVNGIKVHDTTEEVAVPRVGTLAFVRRQFDFDWGSAGYNANNHNTEGPYLPQTLSERLRGSSVPAPVVDVNDSPGLSQLAGRTVDGDPNTVIGFIRTQPSDRAFLSEQAQVQGIEQFSALLGLNVAGILAERSESPGDARWFDRDSTRKLKDLLKQATNARLMVYRLDRLAPEEFVNLRAIADLSGSDRSDQTGLPKLLSVTEIIEAADDSSDIVIRSDPSVSERERTVNINRLQDLFRNRVVTDLANCLECPSTAQGHDIISGDGSTTYYRTMHICNGCHNYSIGREQWTTDY